MVDRSNDALMNYHDNLWILFVIEMCENQWFCRRHCWARNAVQWLSSYGTHAKLKVPHSDLLNQATNRKPQKESNQRPGRVSLTQTASGVTPA